MSPRPSFFSPKGRLTVSRPLAITMNTLNILAPALLLVAIILAGVAKLGAHPLEIKKLLLHYAAIAVGISLLLRVVWGLGIRLVRQRSEKVSKNAPSHGQT
jgi:hypothetical protein